MTTKLTTKELHEKYGIPYVEVTRKYPPKRRPLTEDGKPSHTPDPDFRAAVERVLTRHQEVLRALAKR